MSVVVTLRERSENGRTGPGNGRRRRTSFSQCCKPLEDEQGTKRREYELRKDDNLACLTRCMEDELETGNAGDGRRLMRRTGSWGVCSKHVQAQAFLRLELAQTHANFRLHRTYHAFRPCRAGAMLHRALLVAWGACVLLSIS
jgi:hypothetical protein